ncbi:MAG: hypothetical protein LBT26_09980 [Clostridiales Family XIII bacterium]|nr:hypothetical protein [Clostridiales Family XIII bacterium]
MLIPIFSSSIFVYCLFLFLSVAGADHVMDFSFFVFLACAFAAAAVNFRLSLREQTLARVVAANAGLAVLTEFLVFAAPNGIEGVWLHFIAAVFFLTPAIHSLQLSREPIRANTMLLFAETSIVGTVLVFLLQLGSFRFPPAANALCVAALVLNLFTLSSMRISGPAQKRAGAKNGLERGFLLASALTFLIAAALAAVLFLVPVCRSALLAALAATRDFLLLALRMTGRFFVFLISLLPRDETQEALLPAAAGGDAVPPGEEFTGALPDYVLAIVISVLVLAAAAGLLVFLFRFRKLRLARLRPASAVYKEEIESASLRALLLSALRTLLGRLRFLRRLMRKRGTYEGVFLRIARCAGRRGAKRGKSETPEEYLARLLARIPEDCAGHACAARVFPLLAARVDSRCYSARPAAFENMDRAEARTLLRAVKMKP